MAIFNKSETTAAIRAALKEAFPGFKFACTTYRGTYVRVEWANGPAYTAVHEIAYAIMSEHRNFGNIVRNYTPEYEDFCAGVDLRTVPTVGAQLKSAGESLYLKSAGASYTADPEAVAGSVAATMKPDFFRAEFARWAECFRRQGHTARVEDETTKPGHGPERSQLVLYVNQ